jgi:hypothetical protein
VTDLAFRQKTTLGRTRLEVLSMGPLTDEEMARAHRIGDHVHD